MAIEIDHISLSVQDYERAKAFYTAALAPLRVGVLMEFPMDNGSKVAGLGADGHASLWISGGEKASRTHIAFRVENRGQVDAFHAAAMAAGGVDHGGPGIREMYSPTYYAAYVLDPEGHNIEAVTNAAPAPARKAAGARKTAKKAAAKPARKAARKAAARKAPAKMKPAAKRKPAGKK